MTTPALIAKPARRGAAKPRTKRGYDHRQAPHIITVYNSPGEMVELPIWDLRIDPEYQRPISEARVGRIAANWNWVSAGALIISMRENGHYFIIDGQHRWEAAKMRKDITKLPCIVFPLTVIRDEAAGFLTANYERRPPSTLEKFPAMLAVGDRVALKAQELISQAGLHVAVTNRSAAGAFLAVGELLRALRGAEKATVAIWPTLCQIYEGRHISGRVLRSLVALEARLQGKASLADPKWFERLVAIGAPALERAIRDMAIAEGKHTERGAAMAVSSLINKGLKTQKLLVDLS